MKTGSCRHCGYTPVATNAPVCPNCGGLHPTGYQWWPLFVVLGVALALLILVSLIISSKPRRQTRPMPYRVLQQSWRGAVPAKGFRQRDQRQIIHNSGR